MTSWTIICVAPLYFQNNAGEMHVSDSTSQMGQRSSWDPQEYIIAIPCLPRPEHNMSLCTVLAPLSASPSWLTCLKAHQERETRACRRSLRLGSWLEIVSILFEPTLSHSAPIQPHLDLGVCLLRELWRLMHWVPCFLHNHDNIPRLSVWIKLGCTKSNLSPDLLRTLLKYKWKHNYLWSKDDSILKKTFKIHCSKSDKQYYSNLSTRIS